MNALAAALEAVNARIAAAARRAHRDPAEVQLIAVTKTFPAVTVALAADAGLRRFGENRIQEAAAKLPEVAKRVSSPLEWHFIGPLQRNKARRAVELFDVLHSVDRPQLVAALAGAAESLGRRPRVFAQINVDEEPQKAGALPDQARQLVELIVAAPALALVGLMAIPRARPDAEQVRPSFRRLRQLRDQLQADGLVGLEQLSMGMSADFEVAIEEGATCVRVGTAIFGRREVP